jgi:glutathione S-transferase
MSSSDASAATATASASEAPVSPGAPLTLFVTPPSQPCRAVQLLLAHCSLPHRMEMIGLMRRDQDKPAFREMNPAGEVPVIMDAEGFDFALAESHAILKYLSGRFPEAVADHFYPRGYSLPALQKRARIDAYLDWQHSRLREHSKVMVRAVHWPQLQADLMGPRKGEIQRECETKVKECLDLIEKNYLRDTSISSPAGSGSRVHGHSLGGPFLLGFDEPSIADLSAICEINMLELIGPCMVAGAWGPQNGQEADIQLQGQQRCSPRVELFCCLLFAE